MNVSEINPGTLTLKKYFATAIPLTVITIWIMIAFQYEAPSTSIYKRLVWPVLFLMKPVRDWRKDRQRKVIYSITSFHEEV